MNHDRLMIKTEGRILIICQNEINWLEAEGHYVRIYFRNKSQLIRAKISELEEELNPHDFLRINRSAILNLDFIQELKPWFRGTYRTILKDGTELTLSKGYRGRFHSMFTKLHQVHSLAAR